MAKAKDYGGIPAMSGRLDTAAGEQGEHIAKLAPALYGRDPETVNQGPVAGTQSGPVSSDATAQEVLGAAVKEIQTIDPMDHTQIGSAPVPGREGTNDVAVFQSDGEVNPTVPPNAEASVAEDGSIVPAGEPAPENPATDDGEAEGESEGEGGEPNLDDVEIPEPTADQLAAVDAEGNADAIKALVVARGFAEPKTKHEAVELEAICRLLQEQGLSNEQIVALLTAES